MARYGIILGFVFVVSACGPSDPPVAGKMTAESVCQTAGYLIRQQLGSGFQTIDQTCHVWALGGGSVEVESGYVSPLGPTLRYTARGSVADRTLTLKEIRVHGVDDEFSPFRELGR